MTFALQTAAITTLRECGWVDFVYPRNSIPWFKDQVFMTRESGEMIRVHPNGAVQSMLWERASHPEDLAAWSKWLGTHRVVQAD